MIEEILPAAVAVGGVRGLARCLAVPRGGGSDQPGGAHLAQGVPNRPCLRLPCAGRAWPSADTDRLRRTRGPGMARQGSPQHHTLCRNRASAVAEAHEILTLGIDAEPHEKLPGGVREVIARPGELTALRAMNGTVHWDRLLFSAKETVYKAWFPLAGLRDGHHRLRGGRHLHGPDHHPQPDHRVTGRWTVSGGLLATAIAVPRNTDISACL